MTTLNTTAKTSRAGGRFRLPDIPEKHPDDMTSFSHLAANGNAHHLAVHLGSPDTTIVSGERYMCVAPGGATRYPDLLVAFGVDPELYEDNNGYIVSEQGRPPDLALEIASRHTWRVDIEEKPEFYAGLGVAEYWRFDETGEFHGTRLAGDRLVEGRYEAIAIEELPGGELRGYSEVLGLYICWRDGRLDWYDSQAEDYIPSLESERSARITAEARADAQQTRADLEREARMAAESRAEQERSERLVAESRAAELEAELRRLRGE